MADTRKRIVRIEETPEWSFVLDMDELLVKRDLDSARQWCENRLAEVRAKVSRPDDIVYHRTIRPDVGVVALRVWRSDTSFNQARRTTGQSLRVYEL